MNFVISILIGIALGFISGIVPGLHPNFIGALLIYRFSDWWILPTFVVMLVTSQFFEVIRSTFFFVPEESNILAMHPIFRFVNEGKSLAAIKLITLGTLASLFVGIILSPILIRIIPFTYLYLKQYVPYLLLTLMIVLILKDKHPHHAMIIFSISGVIGYFGLKLLNQPLLILLTGFFGLPILMNVKQKMPRQLKSDKIVIKKKSISNGLTSALASSLLLTFIPAVGPAQASLFSRWALKKKEEFLISIGAISGFDIIFSTILLFTIGKARIGVLEMLGQKFHFSLGTFVLILLLSIAVGIIAYLLTAKIGKLLAKAEDKLNYNIIKASVVVLIISVTIYFDGALGLLFLTAATLTGILTSKLRTNMSNCMGSLVIPTLAYYLI